MRVDEDNGRAVRIMKGRDLKVWWFPRNECHKDIGCLVLAPTFGLGWTRLWDT